MKKLLLSLIFMALMAALAASSPSAAAAAENEIGAIAALEYQIEHNPGGDSGYAVLSPVDALSLKLNENDMIRSYNGSTAEIKLTCGAVIQMAPGAEIQLGFSRIRINKGGAWINYKSKKKDGKISFTATTPAGTMGIKGTIFAAKFDEKTGSAFLQVKEGLVEFRQTKTNKTVDVAENQLLTVEKGKPLSDPVAVDASYDVLTGAARPNNEFENYQNTNPFDRLRKK